MILYTIVDPDVTWYNEESTKTMEITYKGVQIEVKKIDEKHFMINRIFSTDLKHYLNPELQPGSIILYDVVSEL